MEKFFRHLLVFIAFGIFLSDSDSFAQNLSINNAAPDASAILDMAANNRGILIPRMTLAAKIFIPISLNGWFISLREQ